MASRQIIKPLVLLFQRHASLARSPAPECITIQSAAPGFAYSEGDGWNSELFLFSEPFRFFGFSPPKYLSPRDLVRREDSQFMESPAGLPTPRLNLTNSVASRQIIKPLVLLFQRVAEARRPEVLPTSGA